MPNDLNIQAVTATALGNESVGSGKPTTVAAAASADVVKQPAQPTLNPTMQLDSALGVVVLEFLNSAGTVTSSIPSQQQLNAYRQWQNEPVGPAPQLGTPSGASAAPLPAPSPATSPPAAAPTPDPMPASLAASRPASPGTDAQGPTIPAPAIPGPARPGSATLGPQTQSLHTGESAYGAD
jgi:hypothetical protein